MRKIKKHVVQAVTLGLLAMAGSPAGAVNLLSNGGFEAPPVGVDLVGNTYSPDGMVQQYPTGVYAHQYLSG